MVEHEVANVTVSLDLVWSFVSSDDLVALLRGAFQLAGLPSALGLRLYGPDDSPPDWPMDSFNFWPSEWDSLLESSAGSMGPLVSSRMALEAGVEQCVRSRLPVRMPALFEGTWTVAVPFAVELAGQKIILGAVAWLEADITACPTAEDLARRIGIEPHAAVELLEELRPLLPKREAVGVAVRMVGSVLRSIGKQIDSEFSHRLELAAEQARRRQYLVRAESVERQRLRVDESTNARTLGIGQESVDALLNVADLGVIVEDTDYNIRYLNPYLKRHFGDSVGRKCYEVLNCSSGPCSDCPISRLWDEGRSYYKYTSSSPKTGQTFEVISIPIVGAGGDRLVLEVGINVTNLIQESSAHHERVSELLTRNSQLLALVRGMNLSLYSVVSSITDAASNLAQGVGRVRSSHEHLFLNEALPLSAWAAQVEEHLRTTGVLVDQIRRMSVALGSAGQIRTVDMQVLLSRLAEELPKAQRARLSLPPIPLPIVEGDSSGIEQLIAGSLSLALDYDSRQQSTVAVTFTRSGLPGSRLSGDLLVLEFSTRCGPGRPWPNGSNRLLDATNLNLLAEFLGGSLALEEEDARLKLLVQIPVLPPNDLRRSGER